MSWAELLGQPAAVRLLRGAMAKERLAHAWLFAGPEGTGKRLAARLFAAALLCRERPGEGCGSCRDCRRVASREHPDLSYAAAEDEAREIGIDAMRGLEAALRLKPREAARRVAVVPRAERLNAEAANAFLKTLEEPPGAAVIILTSARPADLLPTVVSRCVRVRFAPLSRRVIAGTLRERLKLDAPTAELLAACAAGSLGRALELAAAEAEVAAAAGAGAGEPGPTGTLAEARRFVVERLARAPGYSHAEAARAAEELQALARAAAERRRAALSGGREPATREDARIELLRLLDLAALFWRDAALCGARAGEAGYFFGDRPEAVRAAAAALADAPGGGLDAAERATGRLRAVLRAQTELRRNAREELAVRLLCERLRGAV